MYRYRFRGPHAALLLFDGRDTTAAGHVRLRDIAHRVVAVAGDHIRPCFVVLADRPPASLPAETVVLDLAGEAHQLYGATAEALYLVRPDGHVGFRGQPARADDLLDHIRTEFTISSVPAGRSEPGRSTVR